METLTIGNTDYDVHPERARTLYYQGIIERDGPHRYVLNPGLGAGQRELVEALLDLTGEALP